jgi:hypothetical protein
LNGKGVFTWSDGSKYEGDWKDGKRHGKGIHGIHGYTWSDGSKFEGDWKEDWIK